MASDILKAIESSITGNSEPSEPSSIKEVENVKSDIEEKSEPETREIKTGDQFSNSKKEVSNDDGEDSPREAKDQKLSRRQIKERENLDRFTKQEQTISELAIVY